MMEAQNRSENLINDTATFGGGCFWCLEAVFEKLNGVADVYSGYAGGSVSNPTYNAVCSGETGHAEVVQVKFDPLVISYNDLLEVFFTIHDPTTLNRQGADVGTQYRSVIFYHNQQQKNDAKQFIKKLTDEKAFTNSIVTELSEIPEFYVAEKYHQDYFENNPNQPYCSVVISPKVEKIKKKFNDWVR